MKNYLTLQICGKLWLQPENARFCEKMVFGSDVSSFGEKNRKKIIGSRLSFGQKLSNTRNLWKSLI